MRVSDDQVIRSLAALEAETAGAGEEHVPKDEHDHDHRGHEHDHEDEVVQPAVAAALRGAPKVRASEVARVRARLEDGQSPTADDVATKLIGRLVCDRLR